MKVKVKKELSVDATRHPEYGWLLTTQDTERVLGVGRSVISMNKSNNPDRYGQGVHYLTVADLFDFFLDFECRDSEFIFYGHRNLWTPKGY